VVGTTLNAAYSIGLSRECGSIDIGKLGDLIIVDCPHPNEIFLAPAATLLETVVIQGPVVWNTSTEARGERASGDG